MSTTVRWLLAQPALELTLHAGSTGLGREINCAASSELVAAADWLSGGEVLLTTGLRLAGDASARADYIGTLADVGVAAVGFGVGLGYRTIPAEMIAAADEVGMPLFEVPVHIPFSAITRAVLDQIAADRSAHLVAATRAQPRMTRAAVAGGAAAVVGELADAVRSRVVLIDSHSDEVASAPAATDADLERVRALVTRDPASAGAVVVTSEVTVTTARIGSTSRTFGHLGVLGPRHDDVDRMLIGHAVSLLAMEYGKPQQVRRDAAGLQSDVLGSALDGIIGPTALRVLRRAADPQDRVRVAVFTFDDEPHAQRGAARLADELDQRLRPVFVYCSGVEVAALLRGDDHLAIAAGLLTALSANASVRGGIGPPVRLEHKGSVRQVAESVAQARIACGSAAVGQVVDLAETRSLLALDGIRQVLADAHQHRLAPLIAHDRDRGGSLHASLLAFLEANGNWRFAAAALGIHRHTLRSRIERVEDVLALDLGDARVRAELLLMMLGAAA